MESFLTRHYRAIFIILLGVIAGLSFYVGILEGRQSAGERVSLLCRDDLLSALTIPKSSTQKELGEATVPQTKPGVQQGKFAGSKNGTKYYTPGCAGLNRIKPENIIWFQSVEDATLQGYTPASC